MTAGLALGFGAGVLALGLVLYGTGKLKLGQSAGVSSAASTSSSTATSTSASAPTPAPVLPTPAPPDPSMPAVPATQLPAPPNPALTAAPPEMHAMPINGKLEVLGGTGTSPETGISIGLPLANLKRESIEDTFNDARGGGGKHEAVDILAPRGTPVLAVVEGNVVKLFNSKKGGITVYQYDNHQKYCYYYAHLDRYAEGL
ncbi:MAG: M23 family metallopeptidase [Acidobacteriota bacterium]|nr:M23 family metallopeptidase [Acidobacteriota bacterium]